MDQIIVELQESMGGDSSVANAAWTSTYDKDRREEKYDDSEKVAAIVRRMAREGHRVPFESVIFRFWIRMPIFIDRQHVSHRIASHNGLSGRYRTLPEDWYELPEDVMQILTKAGRDFALGVQESYDHLMANQLRLYKSVLEETKGAEKEGLITNTEYKRVREVIRGVIGTSIMTERTSIFNLHSLANYMKLRSSPHAQAEIQHVAHLMLQEVKKANICPVAIQALEEKGWSLEPI